MPVVIGGDNLPSPVGIGLPDLPNIGGTSGPPASGSSITAQFGVLSADFNLTSVAVSYWP